MPAYAFSARSRNPEIETFGLTGRQGGSDVLPMELQNDDVVDIVVQPNSFLL
jgi:hypothetical protein